MKINCSNKKKINGSNSFFNCVLFISFFIFPVKLPTSGMCWNMSFYFRKPVHIRTSNDEAANMRNTLNVDKKWKVTASKSPLPKHASHIEVEKRKSTSNLSFTTLFTKRVFNRAWMVAHGWINETSCHLKLIWTYALQNSCKINKWWWKRFTRDFSRISALLRWQHWTSSTSEVLGLVWLKVKLVRNEVTSDLPHNTRITGWHEHAIFKPQYK